MCYCVVLLIHLCCCSSIFGIVITFICYIGTLLPVFCSDVVDDTFYIVTITFIPARIACCIHIHCTHAPHHVCYTPSSFVYYAGVPRSLGLRYTRLWMLPFVLRYVGAFPIPHTLFVRSCYVAHDSCSPLYRLLYALSVMRFANVWVTTRLHTRVTVLHLLPVVWFELFRTRLHVEFVCVLRDFTFVRVYRCRFVTFVVTLLFVVVRCSFIYVLLYFVVPYHCCYSILVVDCY